MTGSPFSNVVGHAPGDSTFQNVETTDTTDSTDFDRSIPEDGGTEPAPGVESDGQGNTHEAGQDETAGQTDQSGQNVTKT